ncbi:MAG: M1 family metallopeptidase [Gemmatimonadaceae bacterium]
MEKTVLALLCLACAPQQSVTTPRPTDASVGVAERTAGDSKAPEPAPSSVQWRTTDEDLFVLPQRSGWSGPNRYRSADGSPGPDYWQQRADYTIAAQLDTAAKRISGTVGIRYTNNSPDTLRFVWLQLDQNLYRAGSKGAALYPADSRWGVRGFLGGFDLSDVRTNGRPATMHVDDTMLRVALDRPLPPGGRATIEMGFTFLVPEYGSDRMARDGSFYEIAQWYPRMAVYDDVRGWNIEPYLGQGEFYLEYGDIDYSITVPAGYVVAGSGVLDNPEQVLTTDQRRRLAVAARSDTVVRIIPPAEAVARPTPGTKTWRFTARNVRDVAWAAAPDFRWDATSWKGVVTQAYYYPKANKAWESAAEQTQFSIRTYSELFFPYPYPQATSVAGPVGGMEYPMFVMVHRGTDDPASIFGTLDHEHGHEWFPMIVGSNERLFTWQDEGINTYINSFSNERRYPGREAWGAYLSNWKSIVQRGIDSPLMTAPDNVHPSALGAVGYRKPAAVLLMLRNHVVGPELFDAAFREYTRKWAFKHPTPADFFRTIESYAGGDLSWYWRAFFYGNDVLDIGVTGVTQSDTGLMLATVGLRRMTSVPFPVMLRVRYADGGTEDFRLPEKIWARGDAFAATLPTRARVTGVRLWPIPSVPDWNSDNDTWGDAPPADAPAPATR